MELIITFLKFNGGFIVKIFTIKKNNFMLNTTNMDVAILTKNRVTNLYKATVEFIIVPIGAWLANIISLKDFAYPCIGNDYNFKAYG